MHKYDDWANRKGHSGHRKEVIESCMTFELGENVSVLCTSPSFLG
jgi:hypothetical protein